MHRRHQYTGKSPEKGHKDNWSLKCFSYEKRLRALEQLSLAKRRFRGKLINLYKYLKERYKEDGAGLFPVVPSDRTRGSGHELVYSGCHQETVTGRVSEHWYSLPREVVESPCLERFNCCLDIVLDNLL